MSTDVVIRQDTVPQQTVLTNEQLQYIAATEFVPPGLRGNLPAILACVATGRALGIADMTALRSIHIIDGKATYSAELMVMLVRSRGHSITGEVSEGSATVTGTRADNGDTMSATWTLAMAERAGLLNKQNWRKYPEAMLWARAASQLCRMLFADCFAGNTYTAEELGAEHTDSAGEPLAPEATSPPGFEVPADDPLDDVPFGDDPTPYAPPSDPITEPQKKKLNVLIGRLRDGENLTTEHLYRAVKREPLPDENGELHFGPLRDSLTKLEASELIDRLEKYEQARQAA